MTWKVGDVDRHKKGLSDVQKRRWLRIANSALQECLDDGGNPSSCEALAIRKANGVTGNEQMQSYTSEACDYEIRQEDYQGRPHIVVPVIMMVEGVHRGSMGPLFHSITELGKYPASWNDIPITIQHPQDNGSNVAVGYPDIISTFMVGRVYNTHVEGNQLRGEAWIDENKLRQISPEVLVSIQHKHPLEVSLGMFSDIDPVTGIWNGENYIGIARNHRPDHLALLPGKQGACSWRDGCGIRTNEKGEESMKNIKDILITDGFALIHVNETGMQELVQSMHQKINSMDNEFKIHYLEELYDDYVIYRVVSRESTSPAICVKRAYTYKNNVIEFTGDPVLVKKNISFEEINDNIEVNDNINLTEKEKKTMTNKSKGNPCCAEKVEMLIQSDHSTFVEGDREWLNDLDAKTLDHFMEMQSALEANMKNEDMTKEKALQVLNETLADPEKFKNLLPKQIRDQFDHGLRVHANYRRNLCDKILANAGEVYKQEDLEVMSDDGLEKLAAVIKVPVDHSLQDISSHKSININNEEVLMPVGIGK